MSSPTLHLFSWKQPLIDQAVDWLAGDWPGNTPLDLSNTWVVVPTSQSGRRLREALASRAAESGQAVFPPRVVLPAGLLDEIAGGIEVARRHECMLAWTDVLRTIKLSEFAEVFPNKPASRTFLWAARLARQLVRLHETLAENSLRIADVPTNAAGKLPEISRWLQLSRLEGLYDQRLRDLRLADPQAARIAGIREAEPPEFVDRIVVIGTPDPQPLAVALLKKYAKRIPITVIISGPVDEPIGDNFDEWGRPLAEIWSVRPVTWIDFQKQVHLCANPAGQSARIIEIASRYEDPDRWLAVGTEDKELLAPIHAGLAGAGFASYNPEGTPRKNDPLFELVSLLGKLRAEPAFGTVEALARCPDVLDWLRAKLGSDFSASETLKALDQLRARNLPVTLAAAIEHAPDVENGFPGIRAALAAFSDLREILTTRKFPECALDALAQIFGHREFDHQKPGHSRRSESATDWVTIAREIGTAAGRFRTVDDADAWDLALQLFAEARQTDDKPARAIELQGWLELMWNDAPHLIVAGMNDGLVPTSIIGDAFLPESLRELLGLKTNSARLARDAYILHTLIASRSTTGRVDVLLGKTTAAGDPLRPSRLLLVCEDEQLPARVNYLFREVGNDQSSTPWRRAWKLQPDTTREIERLSVTSFRSYLECPFRFYLKRALRMEAVDPAKAELDALDFGTLCHAAVEAMGRNISIRESTDAETIAEFLLATLDHRMRGRFGNELTLPLQIQLESARQRLLRAAEVQATVRAEGWIIEQVERPIEFDLDGLPVRGTVDRIDRHESSGAIRVFDYKTSDKPANPRDAHLRNPKRNETIESIPEFARLELEGRTVVWKDLQLPLYLHALASGFSGPITCGYFNLPKATSETGIALWEDYTGELQAAADECARGIAAAVKAGRFWPPSEDIKEDYDEFAALFQHGVGDSVSWQSEATQ